MLEDVLTHLHAPLLLVIIQKLWHHLRADLPHTQIFRDNLPHAVTVDFQLICYHSNSQPTIARTICFTRSTLSAVLLIEGLPLLESSTTSSRPSLNRLYHSKTRERDIVSSPYTSCSIPSASDGVFPSRTKNFRLIDTLLCCHGLTS